MNYTLLKQLETKFKMLINCDYEMSDYKNLVILIIAFMTTISAIDGDKVITFNYFQLLELFVNNFNLVYMTRSEYLDFLATNN